jgi:signal transduction histidine kinase
MRLRQIIGGLPRGLALAGLTCVLPLVAVVVGWGGALFAGTWSPGTGASLIARVAVGAGQVAVVLMWLSGALWMAHALTSRPLAQAARRLSKRWLGLDLDVTYRGPAPVTRMATGFWWDGVEYHRSEREARRRAGMNARFHDPQVKWDGLWAVVAGVTVFPVTALPVLGVAGGLGLAVHGRTASGILILLVALVAATSSWRIFPPVAARFLGPDTSARRVQELEMIRADLTQTQAAELERIERGLHDGAQARLVAMGMSMQAAERMVDRDPEAAKAILADARASSKTALQELRSLVRGINPPVLVERGLVDAVRALALDVPVEVQVHAGVPSRPERPVESAIYFAIAELLANVAKHAHARHVTVDLAYTGGSLVATVTDDGVGGIPLTPAPAGSGLAGIARRMAAFGGGLRVDSPAGGPTRATVSVPCVL